MYKVPPVHAATAKQLGATIAASQYVHTCDIQADVPTKALHHRVAPIGLAPGKGGTA
jgi:hypothetical protein